MTDIWEGFKRKREYLVCVDSDGCAMDTMEIKHTRCFGPCAIREWRLESWGTEVQKRWNEINLYTMTRGINRFKGLAKLLKEVDSTYKPIEGLTDLLHWVDSAKELSNKNLEEAVKDSESPMLAKALNWSKAVNEAVKQLEEREKLPFEGAAEGLRVIHERADVAIVSSANQQAIEEEWRCHNLLQYTDILLSQDAGTKAYCIGRLLEKGYETDHVLMVGDAPGDQAAAEENGVLYYPILVKQEKKSWDRLRREALERFLRGTYRGAYQEELAAEFADNLNGGCSENS